jgi:hypothetical protein
MTGLAAVVFLNSNIIFFRTARIARQLAEVTYDSDVTINLDGIWATAPIAAPGTVLRNFRTRVRVITINGQRIARHSINHGILLKLR